jgi:hypothetical protein
MPENPSEEEQRVIKRMSDAIARELASGTKKEKIIKTLIAQKWPREGAVKFVESVEAALDRFRQTPEGRRLVSSQHKRRTVYGVIWLCGGAGLALAALFTSAGWSIFLAAGGAFVFGIAELIRGVYGSVKLGRMQKNKKQERASYADNMQ